MGRLAQRTGTTVEQFSGLAFAAKQNGVETDQLSKSLVILSKNLESSSGQTEKGRASHAALATLFAGSIPIFESTDDAFTQIAQKLAVLPDGYEKTAIATQVFGKAGAALIPLLNQGAKGIQAAREEAQKLGVVFSTETAQAAEKFEQNLKELKAASEGLGNAIAQKALPALISLSEAALGFAKSDLKTKVKEVGDALGAIFSGASGGGALGAQFARLAVDGKTAAQELTRDAQSGRDAAAAAEAAAKAAEKLRQNIVTIVEALKVKIATIGQTTFQVKLYELAVEGASLADLHHIQSLNTRAAGLAQIQKPLADIIKLTDAQIAQIGQQIEITKQLAAQEDARSVARLGQLLQEGSAIQKILDQGLEGAGHLAASFKQLQVPLSDLNVAVNKLGENIGRDFEQAILHGKGFKQLLIEIIEQFAVMIIRLEIIKPLLDSLGSAANGGGFLGFIGSILKGFAGGGDVSGGVPIVVGESGPEIFMPSTSGTIIPNGAIGGGVTNNYIDARGADPTVEFRVRRAIAESENRAVAKSVVAVREMSLRTT